MPKIEIQNSVGLDGVNNESDTLIVQKRLIELGFDWLQADGKVGPQTTNAIKLFQAMKNGLNNVSNAKNDGLINVGGATHLWLEAKNAPRWQLMPAGSKEDGYINVEVTSQTWDNHDYGCDWLAETLKDTGAYYRDSYIAENPFAALFSVNDVSIPQGGDTPDHSGHESGLACDVQLPHKNGNAGGITVSSFEYDRDAMRAMLIAFKKQNLYDRVYLNDTTLQNEGLCRYASGHYDHAHFEIKPPIIETD